MHSRGTARHTDDAEAWTLQPRGRSRGLVFCHARRFILVPWTECWTQSRAFDEDREYVGKGIYEGRIHGCTSYSHSKGEREFSLDFTHSVFGASLLLP